MSESGTPEQETKQGNFFTRSIQRIFDRQRTTPEDIQSQQVRLRGEIESDIHNQILRTYKSSLDEAEVFFQPLMQELSQVLLRELRSTRGKRGLMLIIDDSSYEIEQVKSRLIEHARKGKVKYTVQGVTDGAAGIVLYQEFKKLAPEEKVVVFMDGLLGGHSIPTGMEALERMARNTKQNGLPMPYIVGESGVPSLNHAIYRTYPDLYLGTFDAGERTLKVVDSRL